jgi:FtsP/CotA-like multicopper oxidase with cupredoxin domain
MLVRARATGDDLLEPPVVESAGGLLDISLRIEYAEYIGAAVCMQTRLLNGTLPGPTLSVSAGDTMRILFENKLSLQQGSLGLPENTFRVPDHSNLHFHGAHVSGELPSDDVRLNVEPGASFQYETTFPANHVPGTHWVHPHVHGSSSLQVGGGAALVMIVRDPVGYLPRDVAAATEKTLMIQHFDVTLLEEIAKESGDEKFTYSAGLDASILDASRQFRLVNGQFRPVLNIQPGEWQRWRIVFGSWLEDPLNLRFSDPTTDCEMVLLAKDGLYIRDFPRTITFVPIPTGGRADLMVRCSALGTYPLLDSTGSTIFSVRVQGDAIDSSPLASWTPSYPSYLVSESYLPCRLPGGEACSRFTILPDT